MIIKKKAFYSILLQDLPKQQVLEQLAEGSKAQSRHRFQSMFHDKPWQRLETSQAGQQRINRPSGCAMYGHYIVRNMECRIIVLVRIWTPETTIQCCRAMPCCHAFLTVKAGE